MQGDYGGWLALERTRQGIPSLIYSILAYNYSLSFCFNFCLSMIALFSQFEDNYPYYITGYKALLEQLLEREALLISHAYLFDKVHFELCFEFCFPELNILFII